MSTPLPAKRPERAAARLGALQALYQQAMTRSPLPVLLTEFHHHRLGAALDDTHDIHMAEADRAFFDDLVTGTHARTEELNALIAAALAKGWTLDRLDLPMQALLRLAAYELVARADISSATVINEYVELSRGFHAEKDVKFVNGLLDTVARRVRG
ncbi:transcription antitermination factor NusB [Polymorphobacter sp.]|uniref:transcription antitermination factor NusB n=1 Tax=Polymorphobacter sp. TaxID=1909290 RepID=UPI003F72C592